MGPFHAVNVSSIVLNGDLAVLHGTLDVLGIFFKLWL